MQIHKPQTSNETIFFQKPAAVNSYYSYMHIGISQFYWSTPLSPLKIGFFRSAKIAKKCVWGDFNYYYKIDNLPCKDQNHGLCMNEYYIVKETKMTYYKSAR